jgi:hypothetical protein
VPSIRELAAFTTKSESGQGVVELIEDLIANDLSGMEGQLQQNLIVRGLLVDDTVRPCEKRRFAGVAEQHGAVGDYRERDSLHEISSTQFGPYFAHLILPHTLSLRYLPRSHHFLPA